jgi:UDPglucose 6-dehydrogenase/UDP-N-acetyl-D-galactosamine dehydrogenase
VQEEKMNAEDEHKEYSATVCIVGLGYVGLPLAEAFSRHVRVIGYDVDEAKIAELNRGEGGIEFTTDASQIKQADFELQSLHR